MRVLDPTEILLGRRHVLQIVFRRASFQPPLNRFDLRVAQRRSFLNF